MLPWLMLSDAEKHAGIPDSGAVLAGRYRIDAVLGRGGMGIVLSGFHTALQQRVAIKFLLPAAADRPGATARFLREARTAASIQNEHVARIVDVGMLESGVPYMVVEYLEGSDLSHVLRAHGPLTTVQAVDLVLQASEALAEAHALGIVHRDLKPSNLFITQRMDGSPFVKVLDFGLAKVIAERGDEATLTTTDAMMGSPPYMSPEQLRSFKRVDARADVWSLGVILYLLITGQRPFDGDSLTALCLSIVTDTPAPMRVHRPDVPPELEAAIFRCLEKDVDRRVQSIAELADRIAPFGSAEAQRSRDRIARVARGDRSGEAPSARLSAVPAPASVRSLRGEPPTEQASSWASPEADGARRRSPSLLAGLALLSLLGGGSFVLWTQARTARLAPAVGGEPMTATISAPERSSSPPSDATSSTGALRAAALPPVASAAPPVASATAKPGSPAPAGTGTNPPSAPPRMSKKSPRSDMLDRWK